jgi:hypothetical protein
VRWFFHGLCRGVINVRNMLDHDRFRAAVGRLALPRMFPHLASHSLGSIPKKKKRRSEFDGTETFCEPPDLSRRHHAVCRSVGLVMQPILRKQRRTRATRASMTYCHRSSLYPIICICINRVHLSRNRVSTHRRVIPRIIPGSHFLSD